MLDAFKDTVQYFNIKSKVDEPSPLNWIFRLHYQITFGALAVAVVLVTGYSYIDTNGAAIQCMMDKGAQIPGEVINNYCWIMSTYSLPKYYDGVVGRDVIAHGVGPHEGAALDPISLQEGRPKEEQVYHAYYQWVPLFLSFQALMFYIPYQIFTHQEGGRYLKVMAGLAQTNSQDEMVDVNKLVNYMNQRRKYNMTNEHNIWAIGLYACELLNFINVIVQIKLTDTFLGGAFSTYGIEAASFSDIEAEVRVDPMYRVFPRMTKCMFHKFGVSGTIEKFDALCVLGMNIINEKIFILFWFWYVILAILSGIMVIQRMAELFVPKLRVKMLQLEQFGLKYNKVDPEKLACLLKNLSYSDWLFLYCLARCMNPRCFKELIDRLPVTCEDDESKTLTDHVDGIDDGDVEKQSSTASEEGDFHRQATLPLKHKLNPFKKSK